MYVLDATPLIYLASVDRLDILDAAEYDCVIPQPVYDEVVTVGLDIGHPDARRLERVVDSGMLSVRALPETDLVDRLRTNPNLSEADVAVIALAAIEDGIAVMDERYGWAVADAEAVETTGTIGLLGRAIRNDHVTGEEAVGIVDDMVAAGWYCSTDLYSRIVRRFRELDGEG